MVVIYTLQRLCFGHLAAGDWAAVRSSADESLALATSLGQHALTAPPLAWLTLLAALQGRDDYDTLLADLEQVVAAHPLGILTDPVHDLTRWAKGAHAAAAGDAFGALHHLSRMRLPVLGRMAACRTHRRRGPRRSSPTWPGGGSRSSPRSPTPPAGRGRWPPSRTAAR